MNLPIKNLKLKINKRIVLVLSCIALINSVYAQFPGCPDVNAGADMNTTCADYCVDLTAIPFETGSTDSYVVNSIPHTPPIAYDEPGGTPVSVGADDAYSPEIAIPFTFCFYGQAYNSVTVGSNGAISLGGADANGYHPYSFNSSVPSTNLVDAGNIFGIYHDVDPTVYGTVKWYIIGNAPCRIFVVSYHELGHYSCNFLRSTFMMVLYETTNAIDVYVEEKETCTGWNRGNAVIGIQNPAGTQGIAAPGRNTGNWTVTTPEGWRFSPDGAPIYNVEWFDGPNLIEIGLTTTVCPTDTTTYTAVATYNSCDGQTVVVSDEVVVNPPANAPSVDSINIIDASCNGATDGEIEVAGSGGVPGYNYSIDSGTTYQASGVFSGLSQGTYIITVEDAAGCLGAGIFEVGENPPPDVDSINVIAASCGLDDGEIEVSASNGTPGYEYSIDGGTTYLPAGTFTGLTQGTYTITVQDADGCIGSDIFEVGENPPPNVDTLSTVNASCGLDDGEVEVQGFNGTPSYDYSIDGGTTYQDSAIFTGLTQGTYTVTVQDSGLCTGTVTFDIGENPPPDVDTVSTTPTTCLASNGEVEVQGFNGTPSYEYSIDGGTTYQASGTFIGLNQGTYTVIVQDSGLCTGSVTFDIDEVSDLALDLSATNISCFGANDGEIQATGQLGSGSYNYSLNSGTLQTSGTFSGLSPGLYTVTVEDTDGCSEEYTISIYQPNELILSVQSFQDVSCFGLSDGSIETSVTGGNGAYEYSIDSVNYQPSNTFVDLESDTYTLIVIDANGCSDTITQEITEPAAPSTTISYDSTEYCADGNTMVAINGLSGGTFSSTNGLDLNTNDGSINLDNSDAGDYTVVYDFTNSNGCPYSTSTDVTVLATPNVDAGPGVTLCEGESWTVDAQGAITYTWSNSVSHGDIIYPNSGFETYIVTGEDANGCVNSDTIQVSTYANPNVNITGTPLSGEPPLTVDFENLSDGADDYFWNFGNGFTLNTNDSLVDQVYGVPGNYMVVLTGTTSQGCESYDTLFVNVEFGKVVYELPNVFTPGNNDNSNDYFEINFTQGIELISTFEVVILNRWGNLIQSYTDPLFKWNGKTQNGNEVSEGTYFYKVNFTTVNNEEIEEHGFVHLIRD
jgi:gliding motility-associated-like protein